MGMSRCYSLMKCLLILFNIIFLAVGGGACAFAAWAAWEGRAGDGGAARAALVALGAWGCALLLGALAALAGALRSSPSLLAAAFALLALSAVAEGAAAWWGAAHLPQLRLALTDRLRDTMLRDYGFVHSRTQVVDAIQHGLQCCGSDGALDWQRSAWGGAQPGAGVGGDPLDLSVSAPSAFYWVPASCCQSAGAACEAARRVAAGARGAAGLHEAACGARVLGALRDRARAPLCAGAALLGAHAAALLLALALCLRARPAPRYKA